MIQNPQIHLAKTIAEYNNLIQKEVVQFDKDSSYAVTQLV